MRIAHAHGVLAVHLHDTLKVLGVPRPLQAEPLDLVTPFVARAAAPPTPLPAPRRVVHAKFGEGTVVSQEGEGDDAKLAIAFSGGVRRLQARFVKDV